jgi:hypothetical protein
LLLIAGTAMTYLDDQSLVLILAVLLIAVGYLIVRPRQHALPAIAILVLIVGIWLAGLAKDSWDNVFRALHQIGAR